MNEQDRAEVLMGISKVLSGMESDYDGLYEKLGELNNADGSSLFHSEIEDLDSAIDRLNDALAALRKKVDGGETQGMKDQREDMFGSGKVPQVGAKVDHDQSVVEHLRRGEELFVITKLDRGQAGKAFYAHRFDFERGCLIAGEGYDKISDARKELEQ